MRARLHQQKLNNETSKEAAPASVTSEDIAEEVNAVSAGAASDAESDVSDTGFVKTEKMLAYLYIHSDQPKIDNCHTHTKDLVDEALKDYHNPDTKIEDIMIEVENKKVRGGKYVGLQNDQVIFDKDFNKDSLKNIPGRPYVFKVKVKVIYQQKYCYIGSSYKPTLFTDAFKDIWPKQVRPDNDVFVSFGGCYKLMG